jgi:hypothetical protein
MEAVVMTAGSNQRRGRSIAMSGDELDAFLAVQRTCRVATNSTSGPHVAPLWFFWDGESIWLNSVVRSQRWHDLQRDGRGKYRDPGDEIPYDGKHAWLRVTPQKLTSWDFRKMAY